MMNMKKLLLYGTLFLMPVMASGGQYVGLHFGSDYPHITNASNSGQKVGYQLGGTWGYDWQNQIRTEFELTYREGHRRTNYVVQADQEESKEHRSVHSLSYMINACYDIAPLQVYGITPFVGAGLGYCQNTDKMKLQTGDKTEATKEHDGRFAYQALAGVKYAIADKTEVMAKYAYHMGHQHSKNHGFALSLLRSF